LNPDKRDSPKNEVDREYAMSAMRWMWSRLLGVSGVVAWETREKLSLPSTILSYLSLINALLFPMSLEDPERSGASGMRLRLEGWPLLIPHIAVAEKKKQLKRSNHG
jgi:hypothetical protein